MSMHTCLCIYVYMYTYVCVCIYIYIYILLWVRRVSSSSRGLMCVHVWYLYQHIRFVNLLEHTHIDDTHT